MKFLQVLKYAKENMNPQRVMVIKLSALPSLINSTIRLGEMSGQSDEEILEKVLVITQNYEKQIEETGFRV